MYPVIRLYKELLSARFASRLGPFDAHVSSHICWPWDLDPWMELNNGRTLTLYDLARVPLSVRTGLIDTMRQNRWGMAVAGASVRYRRRIRVFDRFQIKTRFLGWDARFFYIEQSIWKTDGECANQALFRSAVTDRSGIVATRTVVEAMKLDPTSPAFPQWVDAWIAAEDTRPWPPK